MTNLNQFGLLGATHDYSRRALPAMWYNPGGGGELGRLYNMKFGKTKFGQKTY